jgi:hypothetical protein
MSFVALTAADTLSPCGRCLAIVTKVEAIYLRQPEVKYQCDSGQDALIVRVEDAGITGIGEVDRPDGGEGFIEGRSPTQRR